MISFVKRAEWQQGAEVSGIVASLTAPLLMRCFAHSDHSISLLPAMSGFIIAIMAGVFVLNLLETRAARISPVEALRYD